MTVSVYIRHKNYVIMASDSRGSSESWILSENITKIFEQGDYVFNIAGDCAGLVVLKNMLSKVNKLKPLDTELFKLDTGIKEEKDEKEEDLKVDFHLLRLRNDGTVKDALLLYIKGSSIHIENMIDFNMTISAIGCGADCFLAAYSTIKHLKGKGLVYTPPLPYAYTYIL